MTPKPMTMHEILMEAREVGRHAADLEDLPPGTKTPPDDKNHHLGDDTGDLITSAYRLGGAADAADVVDTYLSAFNRFRVSRRITPLTPEYTIANLSWAIRPGGITTTEQGDVRDSFTARHAS